MFLPIASILSPRSTFDQKSQIYIPKLMSSTKLETHPFLMEATFCHFILISLSILLIILSKIQKERKAGSNALNLPPTLPSLPIIGHLHLFTKPLHQALTDLAAGLGPTIFLRFGSRPVVIISSPELAEQCLTTHGVGAADARRVAVAYLISSHCLRSAAGVREEETRRLLRGLLRETEAAAAEWSVGGAARVELKSRLFGMAVDSVMRMVSGKRYYVELTAAEAAEDRGRRFREAVEEFFGLRRASNVGDFLPVLKWVDIVEVAQRLPRFRERMDGLLQELIEEQRLRHGAGDVEEGEEDGDQKTMISVLQSLQMSDPENYSDSFIKDIIMSFIEAGTDTISNTIEWAMSLLLNNPEKLKKARAEIDGRVGRRRLLGESDLPFLPYLRCIISETLRLYPAAPLIVARDSTSERASDGYDVPAGALLLVNAYSIHRSPDVWREPAAFVPERFQSSRAEGSVVMPFGVGRRRCPGEGLAGRAVGLALGSMLQCFEWERVGTEEVEMGEGAGMTLRKVVPLEAVCAPRSLLAEVLLS